MLLPASTWSVVTGRITTQPVADASLPLGTVSGTVAMANLASDRMASLTNSTPPTVPITRDLRGMASDNHTTFVTLAGGGLMAVDYTATPMRIVAMWDKAKISAAGCGGGGIRRIHLAERGRVRCQRILLRRVPHADQLAGGTGLLPTNLPNPKVIYQDPTHGTTVLRRTMRSRGNTAMARLRLEPPHVLICISSIGAEQRRGVHTGTGTPRPTR